MIAAIYARKGSDLYGSLVTAWRWVDWTAVSSLATLAAVPDDADQALVALRDEVLALLAEAEDEPPTKGDPDGPTR